MPIPRPTRLPTRLVSVRVVETASRSTVLQRNARLPIISSPPLMRKPSAPTTTVPASTRSNLVEPVLACMMKLPMPSLAPARNSVLTTAISAMLADSRTPVNTNGAVCGSATDVSVRNLLVPQAFAVSSRTGSISPSA